MEILRGHFRPEFLNRIDEIIVFHSLTREQLRDIVDLQLERVKRTAHGQGVDLEFDATLIDHLALVGYQPEYGARELRRLIRSEIETELARAMLAGEVQEGDRVTVRRDGNEQKVTFERRPKPQRVVEKKPPAPSTSVAREQAEPLRRKERR
jgi:ATP-dependent Clp protease ATP-binding subunit ClpC